MKEFHCILQVAPSELPESQATIVEDKPVLSISLPRFESRFDRTFEEAATALESLPRFFFEPDGSFVWVVERGVRFQLDGSLYDDGVSLLYVELKGSCDARMLEQFLICLGWPETTIWFQLVQYGVYVVESEFRHNFVS